MRTSRDSAPPRPQERRREEQPPRPGLTQITASVRRQFEELTGRRVDSVAGFERDPDGYRVTLEVVEVERIPTSTNLMGSYEVLVSRQGDLVEFNRTSRYHRNQADDAGS